MRPGHPAPAQGNGRHSFAAAANRIATQRAQGRAGPGGARPAGGAGAYQESGGGNRGGPRSQIQKYRDQQLQIKSNDSYKALEKEIAATQSGIRKLEDQELEAMEAVEAAKAQLAEPARGAGQGAGARGRGGQGLPGTQQGLGDELQRKEEERKALAAESIRLALALRADCSPSSAMRPSRWWSMAPAGAAT
jgi:hypothetical protein